MPHLVHKSAPSVHRKYLKDCETSQTYVVILARSVGVFRYHAKLILRAQFVLFNRQFLVEFCSMAYLTFPFQSNHVDAGASKRTRKKLHGDYCEH